MPRIPRPHRPTGLLAALALTAAVASAPSAAAAATVTGGQLAWTQHDVYVGGTQRTWLGYVTGPGPQLAAGTATPIAPATGPTVDGSSPRGLTEAYTTAFPATSGSYDANTGTGTIELDGGLSFASATHAFTISVEKPEVVLSGNTGRLFASGLGGANPVGPYDRSRPLFDLDLSAATITLKADGSRVIGGIVPSLATANSAFPTNYAAGAGPDRDPNTFGAFALTIRLAAGDQAGPAGAAGATGATGATGPAGPTTTIRSVKAILAKAPFRGATTRRVSVLDARGRTVAAGTVKGRVLKVTLAKTTMSLSGSVTLKLSGSTAKAKVKIPS